MLNHIARLLAKTPLYPHWLEFYQLGILREQLIQRLNGSVIEVGAGEGALKKLALSKVNLITNYLATDYSSWDEAFDEKNVSAQNDGIIGALYLRQTRFGLDQVCDALDLPFEDETFDWHVSSEVIEHISDPYKFFSEAARVVKKGGGVILTAPFLYRIHPDKNADFFRILPGGYATLAERSGLTVEEIFSNTGIGASCAALCNQFAIRCFLENPNWFVKSIFLIFMPMLFITTNISGLIVDFIKPDMRFATRYLIVLRKKL